MENKLFKLTEEEQINEELRRNTNYLNIKEMKEVEEVDLRYKKLIDEAEKNNNNEYIHLTKEEMWYLADDNDTNIQDMVNQNEYIVSEEIGVNVHSISKKLEGVSCAQDDWEYVVIEVNKTKFIVSKIKDILDEIVANKAGDMTSDEWYNINDDMYVSYTEYLKFEEILELAYLYEHSIEMFLTSIEWFESRPKPTYYIFDEVKKTIQNIKDAEEDRESMVEMSYYICEMLSKDFKPVARKYKQYNSTHKLIRFKDGKDLMEDID